MCSFKGLKSMGGGAAISNAALVQLFSGAGELSPYARVDNVIPWAKSGGGVKDCFARLKIVYTVRRLH